MRVLGLDPGQQRLGWGLVTREVIGTHVGSEDNGVLTRLDCPQLGVIEYVSDPMLKWYENFTASIHNTAESFYRIALLYNPDEIAAEIVPTGKLGAKSELVISAITVCKVIAYQLDLPWTDYGANTIKKAVTDDGYATKAQVKNAVFELFPQWKERHKQVREEQKAQGQRRPQGIPWDAYDGVAAAVCHHYSQGDISDQ